MLRHMGTEDRLNESIRAILRITGEGQGDLAQVIGVTYDRVNRRLNGRGRWTFAELDRVALHWGLSPLHLLMGPEDAMREMLRVNGKKAPRQRDKVAAA